MSRTSDLADRLADESTALDAEVREIDLLVSQARSESVRHETRRSTATDKLAALGSSTPASEAIDLANQAVTLTRRAALMDAQVEILEAKKKALVRLKQAVDDHAARVHDLAKAADAGGEAEGGEPAAEDAEAAPGGATPAGGRRGRKARGAGDDGAAAPAVSRIILTAQEDLRREIARAMHDGPAQSLTNIVLQAEIVERLVGRDPAAAGVEVHQLVAMVQQTLEATKTFIFDVRPMVLDDLGLVPTLRRAARDRGRRAAIAVEFESLGQDQRLPVELESGLFRILDEALAGYLAARPDRISLRLDWAEELQVELATERTAVETPSADLPPVDAKLPPALAAMVEERRADHAEAVESASRAAMIQLPPGLVRDITSRAETLAISAEILDDGARLRLVAPLQTPGSEAGAASPADAGPAGQ
jgi:two-component system, NarL family, sensor histidine kinase DegS